jgi:hypothetical protein
MFSVKFNKHRGGIPSVLPAVSQMGFLSRLNVLHLRPDRPALVLWVILAVAKERIIFTRQEMVPELAGELSCGSLALIQRCIEADI